MTDYPGVYKCVTCKKPTTHLCEECGKPTCDVCLHLAINPARNDKPGDGKLRCSPCGDKYDAKRGIYHRQYSESIEKDEDGHPIVKE